MMRSFWHHQIQRLVLLLGYAQEDQEMFEGEEVETGPSQSSCTAYDELLEVMDHKIIFLAQLERAFLSS